jgi:RimJ/RimL family protein N-acetyltransferase
MSRPDLASAARADIRRAQPSRAAEYRALMLEAYELHPDAFTSSVAERAALPLSWWESRLNAGSSSVQGVFAAFAEGRMIGAAGIAYETRDKIRHKATLFGMYVPAQFRGAGLGRALVAAVLEHAATRPEVKVIQLTVTQGNDGARALYEKCGFVAFGVEPFAVAVDSGYVSKVHMWRGTGASGRVR